MSSGRRRAPGARPVPPSAPEIQDRPASPRASPPASGPAGQRAVVQTELVADGGEHRGVQVAVLGPGLEDGERGIGAAEPGQQTDPAHQGAGERGPPQQGAHGQRRVPVPMRVRSYGSSSRPLTERPTPVRTLVDQRHDRVGAEGSPPRRAAPRPCRSAVSAVRSAAATAVDVLVAQPGQVVAAVAGVVAGEDGDRVAGVDEVVAGEDEGVELPRRARRLQPRVLAYDEFHPEPGPFSCCFSTWSDFGEFGPVVVGGEG